MRVGRGGHEDGVAGGSLKGGGNKVAVLFADRREACGDQEWQYHLNQVICQWDLFRSSSLPAWEPSGPRERPMADEVRERLPRSNPRRPGEPDEDRESDDLAGLDERVVEERLKPEVHVEGRRSERPAVRRIQDDGRLVPDPIQQQMG